MIKFTLIIWVCSFLGQNLCLAPVQSPILYDSWYECSRAAHKESLQILSKIGYKAVNDDNLATRYICRKVGDSI
jgi:hypothetical protein